jgi:hypothetical protein
MSEVRTMRASLERCHATKASFLKVIQRAVVYSLAKKDDRLWSIFVSKLLYKYYLFWLKDTTHGGVSNFPPLLPNKTIVFILG